MNKTTQIWDVSNTIITLMKSTGNYVYYRMPSVEAREAYTEAMKRCIKHAAFQHETVDQIIDRINGERTYKDSLYPVSFFNRRRHEHRGHDMAIEHAIEIVESLSARFITGTHDEAPRKYRGKGFILYEDKF